jgi:carotenoid cleavage dioxygenase-like enzyme
MPRDETTCGWYCIRDVLPDNQGRRSSRPYFEFIIEAIESARQHNDNQVSRFPDKPNFRGLFAPSRMEVDIEDLEIGGVLPDDLNGVFYRVAPDPQFPPPLGDDIWFNGDGMAARFDFHGGRVDFRQRWVRTEKFLLEQSAGKALFGAYRNPLTDDASVSGRARGTANTNIVFHAGRLLALKEDSPPVAMDATTLQTEGSWDFGGALIGQTFTAHPKVDAITGEMIAFGYAARGLMTPDIALYRIDADGRLTQTTWIKVPYYCMVHDFGVTRDYIVFPLVPIVGSWERLEGGLPHFGWDGSREMYIGVLPRSMDASGLRWFRGPARFATHVMNAFNDGTRVHLDMPVAAGNMFPFFPDVTGAAFDPTAAAARMTRLTLDMGSKGEGIESQTLHATVGEFPRIDDRYATQPYRHGYLCAQDATRPFDLKDSRSATGLMMNTLVHMDHHSGQTRTCWCGPGASFQEPVFAPKSRHAPEGEGYLLSIVNLLNEHRSAIVVLDAQRLNEGPLATLPLPVRLRQGLHGNWVPRWQLSSQ